MAEPLTTEEYVKDPRCPACRSDNIQSEMYWNGCDGHALVQRADCLDCEADWYEVYTLTGYEDLTIPEHKEPIVFCGFCHKETPEATACTHEHRWVCPSCVDEWFEPSPEKEA